MAYDKFQNRSLEGQPRLIKGHEVVLLLFRRVEQYRVGIHIFTHFFNFSFSSSNFLQYEYLLILSSLLAAFDSSKTNHTS